MKFCMTHWKSTEVTPIIVDMDYKEHIGRPLLSSTVAVTLVSAMAQSSSTTATTITNIMCVWLGLSKFVKN